jgi:hypothetical protein
VVEKILFQHELFGHERFLSSASAPSPTTSCSARSSSSAPRSPRRSAGRFPRRRERLSGPPSDDAHSPLRSRIPVQAIEGDERTWQEGLSRGACSSPAP